MQSLNDEWSNNPRWEGVDRPYGAEDVNKLQGTLKIEPTLARVGAERLWDLMQENPYPHAWSFDWKSRYTTGAGRTEGNLS